MQPIEHFAFFGCTFSALATLYMYIYMLAIVGQFAKRSIIYYMPNVRNKFSLCCFLQPKAVRLTHLGLLTGLLNPLVPDAHYSVRPDKPFSLQIQQL